MDEDDEFDDIELNSLALTAIAGGVRPTGSKDRLC